MAHHDFKPTLALAGCFLALLVIIHGARIFYQVFAGPLSRYPGPKLAKATRLVLVWHKIRGREVEWVASLHRRYGDIVQKAPGELSFASGHAWKDIYGHVIGNKTQNFPKDPVFYGGRPVGIADVIFSNDADHTRQRRVLAHAFSDRALREQEPLLQKYVDHLILRLGEQGGNKVDLVRWYNYTTFDIMGDLAFGEPLGNLDAGEYTPWVQMVFQAIKVNALRVEIRYNPTLGPLINAIMGKGAQAQRDEHWRLSADQVNKRLEKKDARPDIWGFVMNAKESQKMTVAEMHSNSQVLMLAGTETTATLLSGLTYLLLTNPDKMERVQKEIREAFSSPEEINIDGVLTLKYVNACFEEALRCYPPVPTGLPRVVPKGGDMICGQPVPGDTRVSVHQLSTYQNPNNFHRPTEFLPQRWLDDPEFEHDQKAALQPFSYGPRNCIGKNLAYLEMRLIFANMVWHYDMSLCDDSKNWTDQRTYTLWEKHPLNVTLQPAIREKQDLMG